MIGMIIWVAVIIVIVNYSRISKKKQKPAVQKSVQQRQTVPSVPNQRQAVPSVPSQRQAVPPVPNQRQQQTIPNVPADRGGEKAEQEALKRRLQQQYSEPSVRRNDRKQTAANAKSKGSDILSRAAANVDEDFGTNTYFKEVEHAGTRPVGMVDDCDLMREVQDLIVMGYQGTMQFNRDFIGEAEDMLNSFL